MARNENWKIEFETLPVELKLAIIEPIRIFDTLCILISASLSFLGVYKVTEAHVFTAAPLHHQHD